MMIEKVTSRWGSPERRRFGRINLSEPKRCRVHLPQSRELWTDQGMVMNISLGGIYFVCDRQPPLEQGDIRQVTFYTGCHDQGAEYLDLHVLVVRTAQRQIELPQFSVAVRLLSNPIYYSVQDADERQGLELDKLRLMYQYYGLNKKAYEIINGAPEIRTEKIKNLKECIEKGYYRVQSEKVTQGVINDHCIENVLGLRR
jgi:anti-sigma28 factor (negative regulator of flagellin synthesis)